MADSTPEQRRRLHEAQARERKAAKLSSHLLARGITVDDLTSMHPDVRAHHAKLAGVNDPSADTWEMVVHAVGTAHKYQPDDPFEGL